MPSYDQDLLTAEELRRLLAAPNPRYVTGKRDRALIAVLYGAGLRISEALALEPKDVDLQQGRLVVQRGKGGKRRIAGLLPGLEGHLAVWLAERAKLGVPGPLFCAAARGSVGSPLDQSQIRHMLRRRASKAGIEKRVHSHGLRHSHADALNQEGVSLRGIQDQLGHAKPSTTDVYLSRISNRSAVSEIRAISAPPAASPGTYEVTTVSDGHAIYDSEAKRFLCFGGHWAWRRLQDLELDMTPAERGAYWGEISVAWPG